MSNVLRTRQTSELGFNLDNGHDFLAKPRTYIQRHGFDVIEEKENYKFKSLGSSMKNGIRMEFRLYNSKHEAKMAAMQSSKGETPIHHLPHKKGDRCHFHVSCHTMKTKRGLENVHFMYGDKLLDLSPF